MFFFQTYHVLCLFSQVQLCYSLGYIPLQAPLSMEFSWQEYWSGLSFPPPDPGIKTAPPASPTLNVDSLPLSLQESPNLIQFLVINGKEESIGQNTNLSLNEFHEKIATLKDSCFTNQFIISLVLFL